MFSVPALIIFLVLAPLVWMFGRGGLALLLGIRVNRITWGIPLRALTVMSTTRYGVEYRISAIPIGVFVQLDAMAATWRRFLVVFGGPLAVGLVGYYVLFADVLVQSPDTVPASLIGEVEPNGPAEGAGLERGDRVIEIDGVETVTFRELAYVVGRRPGESVDFVVERGEDRLVIEVKLGERTDFVGARLGRLGVVADGSAPGVAARNRLANAFIDTNRRLKVLTRLVWEWLFGGQTRVGLGGPVLVGAQNSPSPTQWEVVAPTVGWWLLLLALLSLLPIPPFAASEVVFLGIERVIGRTLPARVRVVAHVLGASLLTLWVIAELASLS
jgi:regulator of sigma E protease